MKILHLFIGISIALFPNIISNSDLKERTNSSLSSNSIYEFITAPDTIKYDVEWNADTVFLEGDLLIEKGNKLSISPGTHIISKGYFSITVEGSIQALGTNQDSIYFTVADTLGFSDTSRVDGGWNGLIFNYTSNEQDSSIFEYCVMEFGKANGPTDKEQKGGVLFVRGFDKISVSHSRIQNNFAYRSGGAFYMEHCSGIVNQNSFFHNKSLFYGGAIYMGQYSNGKIFNNLFKFNSAFSKPFSTGSSGAGAAIYINTALKEEEAPIVYNNRCFNNKTTSGVIYESTINAIIYNNLICNNKGTAIFNGHQLGQAVIVNNTIANNHLTSSNRAISNYARKTAFINNIVWNNYYKYTSSTDTQSISTDYTRPDSVKCNLIMDDIFTGNGNINMKDPKFINPSPDIGLEYDGENYDWGLLDDSPAINTGYPLYSFIEEISDLDVLGLQRIFGEGIEIGAIENQNVLVSTKEKFVSEMCLYPNPVNKFLNIALPMHESWDSWSILSLNSNVIMNGVITKTGISTINNLDKLSNGIYFLLIKNDNGATHLEKFVKQNSIR